MRGFSMGTGGLKSLGPRGDRPAGIQQTAVGEKALSVYVIQCRI